MNDLIDELKRLKPSPEGLDRCGCILNAEVGALQAAVVAATAVTSEQGRLISDSEESDINEHLRRTRLVLYRYGTLKEQYWALSLGESQAVAV